MPTWPASLPQAPLAAGLSAADDDAVLRTPMDAGPPSRRNRFTAITQSHAASIILTGAQLATFNAFYRAVLHNGALSFEWTHPATGETVLYAFKGPAEFSLILPHGNPAERLWQASLQLEVQPGGVQSFDPLALSPIAMYDLWNPATLWQDLAGMVPVTAAAQNVARADDMSGNGWHLTQPDASARPSFFVDAETTNRVYFDGVGEALVSSLPHPAGSITVIVGIWSFSTGTIFSTTGDPRACIPYETTVPHVAYPVTGAATMAYTENPYTSKQVMTYEANFASDSYTIRKSGAVIAADGVSRDPPVGNIAWGYQPSGNNRFLNGSIAQIVVFDRILSAADRMRVEAHIGKRVL